MSKVREIQYVCVKLQRDWDGPVTITVQNDDGSISEVPLRYEDGQYVYRAPLEYDKK